jgi:hypothetical protein
MAQAQPWACMAPNGRRNLRYLGHPRVGSWCDKAAVPRPGRMRSNRRQTPVWAGRAGQAGCPRRHRRAQSRRSARNADKQLREHAPTRTRVKAGALFPSPWPPPERLLP